MKDQVKDHWEALGCPLEWTHLRQLLSKGVDGKANHKGPFKLTLLLRLPTHLCQLLSKGVDGRVVSDSACEVRGHCHDDCLSINDLVVGVD